MMHVTGRFSDRYPSGLEWDQVPGLDDLSPGTGERRRQAKDCAAELCRIAIDVFAERGFKALGVELSVVSRGPNGDAELNTTFMWAPRYHSLLSTQEKRALDGHVDESPYVRAMKLMSTDVPHNADGPEPIVTHPSLRERDLDCVLVLPDMLATDANERVHEKLNETAGKKYRQSDRTTRVALRRSNSYRSTVESRIARFREFFTAQMWEQIKLAPDVDATELTRKLEELENAIISVVPLFRTDYYDASQLVGTNGISNVFATPVAGIVLFAWIAAPQGSTNIDEVKNYALRASRDLSDFFLAVALRDVSNIALHVSKSIGSVRQAYHDIYNLITEYSTKTVVGELFFRGEKSLENFKFNFKQRRSIGRKLSDDETRVAVRALGDVAAVRKMRTHAAILEIQWGGNCIRKKFQDDRAFSLTELVTDVFAECASFKTNSASGVLKPVKLRVRTHVSWIRPKGGNYDPEVVDFIFPRKYLKREFIMAQLFEVFLNARKHGARDEHGNGTIFVEVSGEYTEADNAKVACVIKVRNEIADRKIRAKKDNMLGLVRGIKVEDDIKGEIYEVKISFGQLMVESDGGREEVISPELVINALA